MRTFHGVIWVKYNIRDVHTMLLNTASFVQTCEGKPTLFYWVGLQLHLGKERPFEACLTTMCSTRGC
jgi:hypothetical protein